MQGIDDKELLKSYILGNKMIHSSETKYEEFMKIANSKINNFPVVHSCRHNGKVYQLQCASARAMLEEITKELPAGFFPPSSL